MSKTPMELLLDKATWKCTICGSEMGKCDCWVKCKCGWSYRKHGECCNPEHEKDTP